MLGGMIPVLAGQARSSRNVTARTSSDSGPHCNSTRYPLVANCQAAGIPTLPGRFAGDAAVGVFNSTSSGSSRTTDPRNDRIDAPSIVADSLRKIVFKVFESHR